MYIGNYFKAETQPRNNRLPGFTIVELLIVIVVIGILAAISIVVYNGIQKRAQTAQVTSSVDSLEKSVGMAIIDGSFSHLSPYDVPEQYGFYTGCIGSLSDYPATEHFAEGEYYQYIHPSNGDVLLSYSVNTPLTDALASGRCNTLTPMLEIYRSAELVGGLAIRTRGILVSFDARNDKDRAELYWLAPDGSGCGRADLNENQAVIEHLRAHSNINEVEEILGTDWEARINSSPNACSISIRPTP
ncbi:prepilin-type N-terminal cleavage/methylation domain-containing protein [Corynebacterium callunae]|uniref:Prepilin-type cleavage/methylation protein n=1 Tax=Corynebacterium callunae DSM 20147 TaxID=1121353 RepID=M1UEW3_9CORY|nr:prepilin-type N-terminal cleavage/methylation domain-containing protein [Corynebacterium callunae]AGG66650.1 prepilin-type cleavage/methylation protein [Corynebacterium callunae DSM 20147]